MNTLTPFKLLLLWVIEQGGRVFWADYHQKGIELGCPSPAQNLHFATSKPSMESDGNYRVVTAVGYARAARWSQLC
jgi:hypothetical protein